MAKEDDKITVEGKVVEALREPNSKLSWKTALRFRPTFPAKCGGIIFEFSWGIRFV